jgi:hypothetical protein
VSAEIRLAGEGDRLPMARLFAAVAEERDGIAAEPPVDVEKRAADRRGPHPVGARESALGVFPHDEDALRLYRKFGFVEEGRRVRHIRRQNGELWDLIEMGLLLDQ